MSLLLFASCVDKAVSEYTCVLESEIVCGRTGFANKYASLLNHVEVCVIYTS